MAEPIRLTVLADAGDSADKPAVDEKSIIRWNRLKTDYISMRR